MTDTQHAPGRGSRRVRIDTIRGEPSYDAPAALDRAPYRSDP